MSLHTDYFTKHIAIVTDDPGWHGKRLCEALEQHNYGYHYVSLTACSMLVQHGGQPIYMPGFENQLPDGVFVRGVPGGTLNQVVFWLDVLHALKYMNICVYNDARAIERTVDKAMTSFLLQQSAIPTPPTWIVSDSEAARDIISHQLRTGQSVVSKPLFGSQGTGLRKYSTLEELDTLASDQGIFYLQQFVQCAESSHDFRVFVIRNKAVAAMRRSGTTWLNNVHQGARCDPISLDNRLLCGLAEEAVKTLQMDYAGVDIIQDERGHYSVLEVNSIPAWKGLQNVTSVSIANLLVEDFLSQCDHYTQ